MIAAKLILVADDDEPAREGMRNYCWRAGAMRRRRRSTGRTRYTVRSPRILLIITDLHMPKMDGLELLRTVHANLPDLPTIVLTGTDEGTGTMTEAGELAFAYSGNPWTWYA